MRIVCISDTHDYKHNLEIPDGDILIHAGDATSIGSMTQLIAFNNWLGELPHQHKIFVAGNHDWLFEKSPDVAKTIMSNCHYLENQGKTIEGLYFYGSPVTPTFHNWAFNRDRGPNIKRYWDMIPENTDVLITHGPPYGFGDQVLQNKQWNRVGCYDLLDAVMRVKPKLHIFGHVHGGYGIYDGIHTKFINASICTEAYHPTNKPIVIDL